MTCVRGVPDFTHTQSKKDRTILAGLLTCLTKSEDMHEVHERVYGKENIYTGLQRLRKTVSRTNFPLRNAEGGRLLQN